MGIAARLQVSARFLLDDDFLHGNIAFDCQLIDTAGIIANGKGRKVLSVHRYLKLFIRECSNGLCSLAPRYNEKTQRTVCIHFIAKESWQ